MPSHDEMISAGIVLTGGGAKLPGIDLLAEQVTGWPARVGMPRHLQGLTDVLIDPAYATSVGLAAVGGERGGGKRLAPAGAGDRWT